MSIETEVSELNLGLRELSIYLEIFDDYVKNHYNDEKLNFVNGIISMISMQSSKIQDLIGTSEKLELELEEER